MTREQEAIRRTERLETAIIKACERAKTLPKEETNCLIVFSSLELLPFEDGFVQSLVINRVGRPCWRVGQNPGDSYFELKLVPSLEMLVISTGWVEDDIVKCSGNEFGLISSKMLVKAYTPHQIQAITRLVNKIAR